ncbi:MAG: hypothetical protein IRY94_00945 [Rhodospirillaceae bacterium]|nr:hypothetical protein [Rhodospirillaceae bacterium]
MNRIDTRIGFRAARLAGIAGAALCGPVFGAAASELGGAAGPQPPAPFVERLSGFGAMLGHAARRFREAFVTDPGGTVAAVAALAAVAVCAMAGLRIVARWPHATTGPHAARARQGRHRAAP